MRSSIRTFARYSSSSSQARSSTKLRTFGYIAAASGGIYVYDNQFNASAYQRTLRTAFYGILIAADFKLNFKPSDGPEKIERLHERVAKRLHYLCTTNGGLFIKLGQSIGIQAAILPKPYREAFASIFDAAPPIPYSDIESVFQREFKAKPLDIFDTFDPTPIASASIAQVHVAEYHGRQVAVKVQRPAIPKQMEWDLASYRALLWCYEKLFDMPVYFVAKYVTDQIRKEVDFVHEAQNAEKTKQFLRGEKDLRGKVVTPEVIWDVTSQRIMTAEYTPGCRITDRQKLKEWNLPLKEVMDLTTSTFAAMIFKFGHVHCDPHPGNVLVRPHPQDSSRPQVVLIDHGLYIPLSESFRRSYCELWRAIFTADIKAVDKIAQSWGISNSNMIASATLLRPTKLSKGHSPSTEEQAKTRYEHESNLKETVRNMLQNEQLIPRELIFLTRCMRMIQANNQMLGSPSNRLAILASYANSGLQTFTAPQSNNIPGYLGLQIRRTVFRFSLLLINIGFWLSKVRQWVYKQFQMEEGKGFEDVLDQQIRKMAKEEFGVELGDTAFEG